MTPGRTPIPVAAGLGGADAAPSMVDAAARVSRAAANAARREPRAAIRSFTWVGSLAVIALFVWASWYAPWARGAAASDGSAGVLTRRDLDAALTPLRAAVDAVGARVDRLYERLPAAPGR